MKMASRSAKVCLALCLVWSEAGAFQIGSSQSAGRRFSVGSTSDFQSSGRTSLPTRLFAGDILSSTSSPKKKNLKTFQRYLEIECWKLPEFRELEPVLKAVAESCKQINRIVQRAQTDDLYGVAVGKDGKPLDDNVQGEVQQQLDVLCNTYMLRAFCGSSSSISAVASEEEEECRSCSDVMVWKSGKDDKDIFEDSFPCC